MFPNTYHDCTTAGHPIPWCVEHCIAENIGKQESMWDIFYSHTPVFPSVLVNGTKYQNLAWYIMKVVLLLLKL